jgi:hypothetical protein
MQYLQSKAASILFTWLISLELIGPNLYSALSNKLASRVPEQLLSAQLQLCEHLVAGSDTMRPSKVVVLIYLRELVKTTISNASRT